MFASIFVHSVDKIDVEYNDSDPDIIGICFTIFHQKDGEETHRERFHLIFENPAMANRVINALMTAKETDTKTILVQD